MIRFLKKSAFYGVIVLLYFTITGIYNYSLDPYGILEERTEFAGIRPNEHSLKVHHILQNPNKFNSFLFSNSKGGALHFNTLNNENDVWYNMTYSLGTPEEFYADLTLFLENNVSIKNIVVGLDEGAIYERAISHMNQASRKFVSMEEEEIHWEYLFLPISLKKFLRVDLDKKHIVHDIYEDGNYYAKNAYAADCASFEFFSFVSQPNQDVKSELDFTSQLSTLLKIENFCRKRNINLTFLIHPVSYDNYVKSIQKRVQFDRLLVALEKENVVLFQPFAKKIIQNNSCYWLDRHHYSEIVGDSMLQMYVDFKKVKKLQ